MTVHRAVHGIPTTSTGDAFRGLAALSHHRDAAVHRALSKSRKQVYLGNSIGGDTFAHGSQETQLRLSHSPTKLGRAL
jgi:hypothetical protein